MADGKVPTLTRIRDFFEFRSTQEFSREWKALPEQGKRDIREGIENGTLTY